MDIYKLYSDFDKYNIFVNFGEIKIYKSPRKVSIRGHHSYRFICHVLP